MIKSPPKSGTTTAAKRTAFAVGASLVYAVAAVAGVSALATEPGHTIDASRVLDAGALPGAPPEIVIMPIPVDPAPRVERGKGGQAHPVPPAGAAATVTPVPPVPRCPR